MIIVLLFIIYKLIAYKKIDVAPTDNSLKYISIYLNNISDDVLKSIYLQSYPKNLVKVYYKNEFTNKYNYKIYEYHKDLISNSDIFIVVNYSLDIHFLTNIVRDFNSGYDSISTKNNPLINKENRFYKSNIVCLISVINQNIINVNDFNKLQHFISEKVYITSFISKTKNGFNKPFYVKSYLILCILILSIFTYTYTLIIPLYIISIINSLLYQYQYKCINICNVITYPIDYIYYISSSIMYKAHLIPSSALDVIPPA